MRSNRAFTLVELLVAIAVLAILIGASLPAMRSFIQNNRATAQANDLMTSLNLARSEALKLRSPVTIRAASITAGNEFGGGWTVFADANGDGMIGVDDVELQKVSALPDGSTLSDAAGTGIVTYLLDGRVSGGARVFQLRVEGCRGNNGRNIGVSAVGRVSVTRVDC